MNIEGINKKGHEFRSGIKKKTGFMSLSIREREGCNRSKRKKVIGEMS